MEAEANYAAGHLLFPAGRSRAEGSVANCLFRVSATAFRSSETERRVFKGRHFDRSLILLCIRWYRAYNLSLRNLEE